MPLRLLPSAAALSVLSVLSVANPSVSAPAAAQGPAQFSTTVRGFIKVDAPVVALTHVRVIDGTGAAARENQTIVIRGGNIAEIGDDARVRAPERATTFDLTGKSVI